MRHTRKARGLDRDIRRLRRIVFHHDDAVADRAERLLKRLLDQRAELRALEPVPTDRAGLTWEDRRILARQGILSSDLM